jgi:hypothetical protein
MARRVVAALKRALGEPYDGPHFHQGAQGQPAACYVADCPNPRLDVA